MPNAYRREPLWHIEAAVVVAAVLQLALNNAVVVGPKYLIAGLEILLLVFLRLAGYEDGRTPKHIRRTLSLALTALVSFANISSLVLVCHYLILGHHQLTGRSLILSAIAIYLTNIIIFALWYWQLDGGGAGGRGTHHPRGPVDFLFPQMNTPSSITQEPNWRPTFFDYLFVSMTNGTAFSPTDAMPLTHRAKFLMGIQALVSLSTVALVAARAINILT